MALRARSAQHGIAAPCTLDNGDGDRELLLRFTAPAPLEP